METYLTLESKVTKKRHPVGTIGYRGVIQNSKHFLNSTSLQFKVASSLGFLKMKSNVSVQGNRESPRASETGPQQSTQVLWRF